MLVLVLALVLVLVLDPRSVRQPASQTFDYENEDDDEDEKPSTGHFRYLPLIWLHSNCPAGASFSEHGLRQSLEP